MVLKLLTNGYVFGSPWPSFIIVSGSFDFDFEKQDLRHVVVEKSSR